MTNAICISENKRGRRCTRLAAPGGLLCALHERTPSTPEVYDAELLNFLRDAVAAGRRLEPELAVGLFLELLADNEIRELGFKRVAEMQAEERRALARSARPPHPVAQKSDRRTDREGRHQTQTPDPPPAPEIEDDGIDWNIVEEMDQ
jgi:hypothetical protein